MVQKRKVAAKATKSGARKKRLPAFRSDADERAFWDKHGTSEYFDESSIVDIEIRPARTKQIAVRLLESDVEALQKIARKKGVGYITLAREVLEHWLAAQQKKAG